MALSRDAGPGGSQYQNGAPRAAGGQVAGYGQSNSSTAQPRYGLDKLERGLRAAHAAGNVQDATRLADAYRRERDLQQSEVGRSGSFTEVEMPDGSVVEFPAGMPQADMERALQEHHARSINSGPWENYQGGQRGAEQGPWNRYQSGQQGTPPPPPGFELETDDGPPLEFDIVGGTPVPVAELRKDGGESWLEAQKRGQSGMPPLPPGFELMSGADSHGRESWQDDPIVSQGQRQHGQAAEPWANDPIVGEPPPLEIDIVGGTPVTAAEFEATERARQPNNSLFRLDSDFREKSGVGVGSMLVASARDMFGSRQGAAEYLAKKANEGQGLSSLITGGAQVVQDERGEPAIRLSNGETYRLNDPGLDSADLANVAGNIAAFWTPAAWAARLGKARQVGVLGRSGMQAGAAGATDVALQATFNDGRIDAGRTAAAVAGGGMGELAGTGLGVLAQRGARAYATRTGARAVEGNRLAQLAGIDTPAPQNRLAALANGADEIRAGADPNAVIGRERFGFQYTQGQRTLDPEQQFSALSREELLRNRPGAAHVFEATNRHNQQRLGQAVSDIGERLGGRPGATPAELTQGAASRIKQQADELGGRVTAAYEKAGASGRAAVESGMVRTLPDRVSQAVADFSPNPELTPATARTLSQLREATAKATAGPDGATVKGVTFKAIETQRRIINNNVGAAANPTDRAAMMAVKREFDTWLDDAVEGALVSGDASALQSLKDARALRFEFGRRFEGKGDSDKFIAGLLDGSKTPEELINIALGASGVSKTGGARFIERLRVAADGDQEVVGALRSAHFQRIAVGKNGEPLPMAQIVRNIKTTEYNNASVVKALYAPKEWAEIRGLAMALDPMIPKGNFARSSGSAERISRMLFQRVGGGLPFVGDLVQGVGSVRATVQANKAINQPLRLKNQAPTGFVPASTAGAVQYTR